MAIRRFVTIVRTSNNKIEECYGYGMTREKRKRLFDYSSIDYNFGSTPSGKAYMGLFLLRWNNIKIAKC